MSNTNTGGPAFPVGSAYPGMTLRDYFAAKAMQAFIPEADIERLGQALVVMQNALKGTT